MAPVVASGNASLPQPVLFIRNVVAREFGQRIRPVGPPPACQSALKEVRRKNVLAAAPRRSMIVAGMAALVTGAGTVTPAGI